MKISFCTNCMGRLHHIKQTLPHNMSLANDPERYEFVLLDYNSPDGLQEWVRSELSRFIESGLLSFYRTEDPVHYLSAHAKNAAHRLAGSPIISNLDGDNYISPAYLNFLEAAFSEKPETIFVAFDGSGAGSRITLLRENFIKAGGYNEDFTGGWGFDDTDLIIRLSAAGLRKVSTPNIWMLGEEIMHDDFSRNEFSAGTKNRTASANLNYTVFKENFGKGLLTANSGRPWGGGTFIKNFDAAKPLVI